ncbi:hypothetical protein [Niallia taxi]|uniref:hypothetical protein n=1 Tax=Niallia taxi TaxID=2499688 RepID=UPI0030093B38
MISLDPIRKNQKKVYNIKFLKSGYVATAYSNEIRSGLIRDRLEPVIYGVACLGYASVKDNENLYNRWFNIISRCYNPNNGGYHNYGGVGVTVCDRWLRYDFFLEDLPLIDGYDKELFENGDLHLDKDIKQQHLDKSERIYSCETCRLVSKRENDKFRVNNEHLRFTFTAISPSGETVKATGIKKFAKEQGLNASTIALRLKEKSDKPYKGWVFYLMNGGKE